jgi:signal transduction histidine kinase
MPPDVPSPKARVLVVDDNEANRALAKGTLEDEGYEVVLANGGAEAVAAFEGGRFDCVLLDVRMPGVDGIGACERIRALPGGTETPILFLTALRDIDTFDRALAAGGDDFLTKPIQTTELVLRVQTAIRLRRLGAEVREQYALAKRQRDDLFRLQLQKERLTAFLVHDLKNPVNAMDLHAQLLLRERSLPPSAHESAAQIRTEARRLTRMIMNLLDIAKGEEGQLAPKRTPVVLDALVEQVFAELSETARTRRVALAAKIPAATAIHADEDLLRRVLANLVENATRYAPADTAVTVSAARAPAGMEIRIADAGKGIPAELREKVFDPFVQVSGSTDDTRRGRGLGLAFCRLAIQAHGGRIWIEDASPGAVFCLFLPDGDGAPRGV